MNFKNKFDYPLREIYNNYLEIKEKGRENVSKINRALKNGLIISVQVSYQGDISVVVDKGFQLQWESKGTMAYGFVDLNNLETIATSDQILRMEYGIEHSLELDTSVREILARGTPLISPPLIWSVNQSNGNFTGSTGQGVIIGFIDTGIDFTHPVFLGSTGSEKHTSRILRIWDQGLIAQTGEKPPDKNLLLSTDTYGVEYTNAQINAVLNNVSGATPIRHRDCDTHGTHVAAIAAGDGRATPVGSTGPYNYVGVAPKVDIIMVKNLFLENDPTAPNGADIGVLQQFKDAVTYLKNVVKNEFDDRPLVINYSAGNPLGPHDGLTMEESWLSSEFGPNKGKIFVKSAGNSGNKKRMEHIIITVPKNAPLKIPFELIDAREVKKSYSKCAKNDNTQSLSIDLWYEDIGSNEFLEVILHLPGELPKNRLTLGKKISGSFDRNKEYSLTHTSIPSTAKANITPPAIVNRNNIELSISTNGNQHKTGVYNLTLKASAETVVHAWCSRPHKKQGFKPIQPFPPGVVGSHLNTLSSPNPAATDSIITVAAYDDLKGEINPSSSHGPLVDYSGAANNSLKPDIAAPGVAIMAAKSQFGSKNGPALRSTLGPGYKDMTGTSMAAPHVAGLVALLLEQKGTLDTADILQLLQSHARSVPTNPDGFGAGKLDAMASFNAVP